MKKTLFVIVVMLLTCNHFFAQNLSSLHTIEDTRFNFFCEGINDTYILTLQPETALNDFGDGQVYRMDANYNIISNVINFPNDNDGVDNCCPSVPEYAIDLDGDNFVVYGEVRRESAPTIFFQSLSKYNNTTTSPLIDKRITQTLVRSMARGNTEHYALFDLIHVDGIYYDGTGDYSFSYDPSIPGNQGVLLAFDDNLNENWFFYLRDVNNTSSYTEIETKDVQQLSNGNVFVSLSSFGQLTIGGTTYL